MAFLDRAANRGSISTGYDIENSIRLERSDVEYVRRASGGSSGSRRTWTFSLWFKRTITGEQHFLAEQGSSTWFRIKSSDYLSLRLASGHEFENEGRLFRDLSAWYHIVVAVDTTQSTASNRVKLYINGVQETDFDAEQYPDQNEDLLFGHFSSENFQLSSNDGDNAFSGYMAEHYWIDGTQYAATDFGEFDEDSENWKPKKFTGTFGSEGHYLNFDTSGSLGADSSGNSNTFGTLNNISSINQTTDTPTNNFCTLNANDRTISTTHDGQLINGGLEYQPESGYSMVRGTMGMTKGKWYWECKLVSTSGQNFGVCTANMNIPLASTSENGFIISSVEGDAEFFSVYAASHYRSYHVYDGTNWNSAAAWSDTTNFSAGDIFGFAWDGDNLDLYMSKSGSWTGVLTNQDPEGDPGSNTPFVYHAAINNDENEAWLPVVSNSYNQDMILNFGNPIHSISSGNSDANGYGNFEYPVPDGYYALCSKNLAEFG